MVNSGVKNISDVFEKSMAECKSESESERLNFLIIRRILEQNVKVTWVEFLILSFLVSSHIFFLSFFLSFFHQSRMLL